MGNSIRRLDAPNIATIFVGIIVGIIFGSLPIAIPGMPVPMKLGIAGGPLILAILIGRYGYKAHLVTYTTTSANLMLRSLGLSMYLACLGLDAGSDFLATVMKPAALGWIGFGLLITMLPVMIMAAVSVLVMRTSVPTTAGMLCGAMANPIALGYVNDAMPGNKASVAYAAVYPLCMFLRVIIAQVIVMLWFG